MAPDEARLDLNPLSLPICLEFGPVLKLLSDAGYTGGRLGEWLIQFNEANRNMVGKLELTAEGVLLITPMQSKVGSLFEGIIFEELYIWSREGGGGEAHGARLGWLIDPFRRQAHIYRPGAAPLTLDDPEHLSGAPELPGFVFNVRALLFDAQ